MPDQRDDWKTEQFWAPPKSPEHIAFGPFDKSKQAAPPPAFSDSEPPGGECITSVHRSETIVKSLPVQSRAQRWFHRGNDESRLRLFCVLANAECVKLQRRAQKLSNCCLSPSFYLCSDASVSVSVVRCRDRLCPTCAFARSMKTRERAKDLVASMDCIRFITLTMPHSDRPLLVQLQIIRSAFTRLRKSAIWKRCVTGGVGTIEITFNVRTRQWHPHFHALLDGDFMPHAELREAWRVALNNAEGVEILGPNDRPIVHIEAIGGRSASVQYITKYVTKPGDVLAWDDATIAEFASALAGARTLSTFGNLHGRKLDAADPNEEKPESILICSMFHVQLRRTRLCPAAEAFIVLLCHVSETAREIFHANESRAGPIPDWAFDDAGGMLYKLGRAFVATAPSVPVLVPWASGVS